MLRLPLAQAVCPVRMVVTQYPLKTVSPVHLRGSQNMKSLLPAAVMLLLFCVDHLTAGEPLPDVAISQRLQKLEAESRALRLELQSLRENPTRLPRVPAIPAAMAAPVVEEEEEDYTFDESVAEMKRLVWTKGDFKIVPYGYLWANMAYATARTSPGSYTLYVFSDEDQGEDEFIFDGRNTRLGLDITGPRLWPFNCANSGGKVEIDFQGDFNGTENKGGVMLRHAYWEIKDEDFRLLFGQTWDVISPRFPGTTMYSVYWALGNMGYRRAQLRGERYLAFSDTFLLTLQGSLNDDIVSDFRRDAEISTGAAGWPLLEGRLATTLGYRGKYGRPIELGVSGHIGEQTFDFPAAGGLPEQDDVARRTWSFNVDMRVPITDRLGVQGEFFTREKLYTCLGGALQRVDPNSRGTIRSTGGWIDVWYDWTWYLHSHVGWGVDDPFDTDLTTAGQRTYNQFIFGNVLYDVTDRFLMGLEVSSCKTLYNTKQPGEAVRIEFMGRYGF